ncbi:MAG: ABC transporter permease, partial [Acutalibacteraceae bacterium]
PGNLHSHRCSHYIYIMPEAYKAIFGEDVSYNFITACLSSVITPEQKSTFASELMNMNDVSAVAFTSNTIESLGYILNSLNYVVLVLAIAAALLAIIVLYNLSNININERFKEIATLKVLGFNKREVSGYISHENWILASLGVIIGLVVGIPLHRLVIALAEVDVIRFGRSISPLSFLYAAVLALVFTAVVNLVMRLHLKKIDMVESLKSVE